MSHFTVLVVGNNVEKQLAPYHEFECTGDDNEYVQDIDETEEAREAFKSDEHTATRYKDPQGNLHNPYDEKGDYNPAYWREPTTEELEKIKTDTGFYSSGEKDGLRLASADWKDSKGYRPKVFALPEDWVEVDVPKHTVETFSEFVEGYYNKKVVPYGEQPDLKKKHKYGYALVDKTGEIVKVIDRTNKNAKWDWYQVGGRWNGFFKMKKTKAGKLGKPGLQRMDKDYKPPENGRADIARKCDIDIEGMREEAALKAAKRYDLFASVTAECPKHLSWQEMQKLHQKPGEKDKRGEPVVDWGAAREAYHRQPVLKALSESDNKETVWLDADDFLCTREEYLERARRGAFSTFAVVKDSKWYERGKMGWWGAVADEQNHDEWLKQFSALIDNLPGDTLLTVVDCHI
jgi:hypothetical protein